MYTCTATILGISTSLDNPMVSLVPLLVIMPTSLRIAYYRDASAKLAAYQIVFIESELGGICWEGRNASYILVADHWEYTSKRGPSYFPRDTKSKRMADLRYYDFPILGGMCLVVFCLLGGMHDSAGRIAAVFAVAVIVFELFVSRSVRSLASARSNWVTYLTELKDGEQRG